MTRWRRRMHRLPGAVVLLVTAATCAAASACADRDTSADTSAITDAHSPPELARMVVQMMPRLERLSGLDRVAPLRVRRQSTADARAYVEQRLDQEMPPQRLDAIRRTYVALGLLPDTLDLRALLLDLYTEQVLGYYDPGTTTLFVVDGHPDIEVRPVLAHELVHALQDQHTRLDSLIGAERGNDRQKAAHAALEGHAMVVMFAFLAEEAARRTLDPARLPNPADELRPALAAQNERFPVFRAAPLIIRETLMFPYIAGSDFVYQLWSATPGRERYAPPIDSLLPQSTQQVLQPRQFFIAQRIEPVTVQLPPAPAGATVLHEDDLGQLETAILLEQHLGPGAREIATGWAGDRYRLMAGAGGEIRLHWNTLWRTPAAAAAFAEALRTAATTRWAPAAEILLQQQNGGLHGVSLEIVVHG